MHLDKNGRFPRFMSYSSLNSQKLHIRANSAACAVWAGYWNAFLSHLQRNPPFSRWSHRLTTFSCIWGIPSVDVSTERARQKMQEKSQLVLKTCETLRKHSHIYILEQFPRNIGNVFSFWKALLPPSTLQWPSKNQYWNSSCVVWGQHGIPRAVNLSTVGCGAQTQAFLIRP